MLSQSLCNACVAARRGRKPYEHGRKSASNIGSNTSFAAACAMRSLTVGIPSGRFFPSAFGMYRLMTHSEVLGTSLRGVPHRARSAASRSMPYSSTSLSVTSSTPAAPLFFFTRFHASFRTSLLKMRSYSAWKRRPGCRLAAAHSRRGSCRTLSSGYAARGCWEATSAVHALALTFFSDRPSQGPFPSAPPSRYYDPLGLPLHSARLRLRLIRVASPRHGPCRRASPVPHRSLNACCAPYPGGTPRAFCSG
jgi:hypothetical protein